MKKLFLLTLIILIISCNKKSEKSEVPEKPKGTSEETTMIKEPKETLREQLEAKKTAFNKNADEKKRIAYEDGIKAVKESGILDSALNVGDKAPNFQLPNATGTEVSLEEKLKDGPVILTWYRGGWCPYCNMQLSEYQRRLNDFRKLGANLIAISPELPDKSLSTTEKHKLKFEVLSDRSNVVAEKFGIVFNLTEEVEKYYKQSFSFIDYYGQEDAELPLAATYLIDKNGKIVWAYLDPDYRNRAEPSDIIKALKNI